MKKEESKKGESATTTGNHKATLMVGGLSGRECVRCHKSDCTVVDRQVNCVDVKSSGILHQPGTMTNFGFAIPLCDSCYMNYVNKILSQEMPFNSKGLRSWISGDEVSGEANVTHLPLMAPPTALKHPA